MAQWLLRHLSVRLAPSVNVTQSQMGVYGKLSIALMPVLMCRWAAVNVGIK